MPVYLQFRGWSGKDAKAAAGHLTGVLKLENARAMTVLEWLVQGRTWKFPKAVADRQAQQAFAYFSQRGFQLDLIQAPPPAPPAEVPPVTSRPKAAYTPNPDQRIALGFHGTLRELAPMYLVNGLVVVLTLGLAYSWAKTRVRLYLWGQTSFGDDRLAYHGTWKELFFAWLKLMGIVLLVLGIGKGLFFVNPILGSAFDSIIGLLILFGFPALMVGAMRYRLSRTSWRGIRFTFRGLRREAVWLNFLGTLSMVFTLGLSSPWFLNRMTHFWRSNSWFGNMQFRYDGQWQDFFKLYLWLWLIFPGMMLLSALIPPLVFLGVIGALIYGLWLWTYIQRYLWSHTYLGEGTFEFTATTKDMARLLSGNSLIRLLPALGLVVVAYQVWEMIQTGTSVGGWLMLALTVLLVVALLAISKAWITCRNLAFRARHLSLVGPVDLDRTIQEMKESGALGEDALDWMDVPLDVI